MTTTNGRSKHSEDDRLPLRWGVILAISVGAGVLAGVLAGPLAGLGAGVVVCGLLYQVLGH